MPYPQRVYRQHLDECHRQTRRAQRLIEQSQARIARAEPRIGLAFQRVLESEGRLRDRLSGPTDTHEAGRVVSGYASRR